MWLSDYIDAIKGMQEYFGDSCWMDIRCSIDGSIFIFRHDINDEDKIVYFRKTGRIEHWYNDTWRNPEHKKILREGK